MKINVYIYIMIMLISATFYGIIQENTEFEETITYFPPDPTSVYKTANTTLTLLDESQNGNYSILWRENSNLDQSAFLRQDISFLFKNGRLHSKMGKWEQNTDKIVQEEKIIDNDSSYFTSITFHHAELHNKQEIISSSQSLSGDHLYVIASSFSPLSSFRTPSNSEEKEWKKLMDKATNDQLKYSWEKSIQAYSINKKDYFPIVLTDFIAYKYKPLPGYSLQESQQIIGKLWEGLYKNYFLGIKLSDKKTVDSLDSLEPLVMLAKNKEHLIVLTETKDGVPILLRQQLSVTNPKE